MNAKISDQDNDPSLGGVSKETHTVKPKPKERYDLV